ncbi:hypothetical protein DBV39_06175 [Orrella marina]|uniref:Uncharacterized protein n=1 Tax=Orrella marina TaxID=2163011 RepID=A0A2R4XI19_9BURK|nr:hypothetical protein DBV39_06175 [Orrella marina]
MPSIWQAVFSGKPWQTHLFLRVVAASEPWIHAFRFTPSLGPLAFEAVVPLPLRLEHQDAWQSGSRQVSRPVAPYSRPANLAARFILLFTRLQEETR